MDSQARVDGLPRARADEGTPPRLLVADAARRLSDAGLVRGRQVFWRRLLVMSPSIAMDLLGAAQTAVAKPLYAVLRFAPPLWLTEIARAQAVVPDRGAVHGNTLSGARRLGHCVPHALRHPGRRAWHQPD